jgi:hypothetical protein
MVGKSCQPAGMPGSPTAASGQAAARRCAIPGEANAAVTWPARKNRANALRTR